MEELDLSNILDESQIEEVNTLFEPQSETLKEEKEEKEKDKEETTEVEQIDQNDLFELPESVGSEDNDNKEKEDTTSEKDKGTSPNFYSSIAKALKDDGIFPDLNDETTDGIKDAETFADAIEQQISARLDERQKRIESALNAEVEITEIQKYENTLKYLDSIKEDKLTDEGQEGENLRKQLIYQDFINRGYSKERATREVQKSFNSGSDIDDAKEALLSNKQYFDEQYKDLIKEAQEEKKREENERQEITNKLKKSILEDQEIFGDLKVDKSTRQKVLDNISKPIYKDPDTGQLLTALQKYESENRLDFIKNIGLIFTLTNGFKDLNGLVKGKVNLEFKKNIRELEHKLNNTSRTIDGNLKFTSGVSDDAESAILKGWSIDV